MVRTILNRAGIVNGRQEKEAAWPGAPPGVRATCLRSIARTERRADALCPTSRTARPFRRRCRAGLMHRNMKPSFDHLVGRYNQRAGHGYSSPFALHCWHAPQRIPFIVAELGRDADPFIAIAEGTSPYRSKPTRTSFDHLVRAQQDRSRQLDPERLGGLEVDHHLVLGPRLLAISRH